MSREPESLLHEVDYWMAVLDDLRDLNDLVKEAADALIEAPVALLEVAVRSQGATTASVESASHAVAATMKTLNKMAAPLDRLLALVGGRLQAMRAEMPS